MHKLLIEIKLTGWFLWNVLSRGEVGAGARLSPDPHEEGFELSFVQLLEGSVDISLVGGQNGHDVLTTEASSAAQLVVLQTSLIHD